MNARAHDVRQSARLSCYTHRLEISADVTSATIDAVLAKLEWQREREPYERTRESSDGVRCVDPLQVDAVQLPAASDECVVRAETASPSADRNARCFDCSCRSVVARFPP
jgi:hypothetical protein